MSTSPPISQVRRSWLAVVAAINALAAWGGAVALMVGGIDLGERLDDRLPFASPALAGVALATVVAIPLTVLAWSAWNRAARTDDVALIVGVLLIGWIVVQIVVLWAFSPFQPMYLCIGAYFVAASHRVRFGPHRRGAGGLPHPIRCERPRHGVERRRRRPHRRVRRRSGRMGGARRRVPRGGPEVMEAE